MNETHLISRTAGIILAGFFLTGCTNSPWIQEDPSGTSVQKKSEENAIADPSGGDESDSPLSLPVPITQMHDDNVQKRIDCADGVKKACPEQRAVTTRALD